MQKKIVLSLFLLLILTLSILSLLYFFPNESAVSMEFNGDRAYSLLADLCDIGPRALFTAGHLNGRDYINQKLREFLGNSKIQTYEAIEPTTNELMELYNIIGTYGNNRAGKILLGTHWDSRNWADRDPNPENWNIPIIGANDSGSGVAVLLAMAEILGREQPDLAYTIEFVFFDGEEYVAYDLSGSRDYDMLGSYYYVEHMNPSEVPDYVIIIDMIGDNDLKIFREGYSDRYSEEWVDKIWNTAIQLGYEDYFVNRVQNFMIDDHQPFIQAGIPTALLIDFDYPPFHTIEDTLDKCSPQSLKIVGDVLMETIVSLP